MHPVSFHSQMAIRNIARVSTCIVNISLGGRTIMPKLLSAGTLGKKRGWAYYQASIYMVLYADMLDVSNNRKELDTYTLCMNGSAWFHQSVCIIYVERNK